MKSVYRSAAFLKKSSFGLLLLAKTIASCQLIPEEYRFFAYRYIRLYSIWRKKAFCYMTGRSRGHVSAYAVSRLCFKAYAISGEYSGLKKFVW